jgi:hypothetical protein
MEIICWYAQRQLESRGFVSMRLLPRLVASQSLIFGASYVHDFGKIKRVLNPWDVMPYA